MPGCLAASWSPASNSQLAPSFQQALPVSYHFNSLPLQQCRKLALNSPGEAAWWQLNCPSLPHPGASRSVSSALDHSNFPSTRCLSALFRDFSCLCSAPGESLGGKSAATGQGWPMLPGKPQGSLPGLCWGKCGSLQLCVILSFPRTVPSAAGCSKPACFSVPPLIPCVAQRYNSGSFPKH